MPTKRIETVGSVFEIDENDMRYRRFPKVEAPREKPDWSTGILQDGVWHPYVSWEIRIIPSLGDWERLCITTPGVDDECYGLLFAPIEPKELDDGPE